MSNHESSLEYDFNASKVSVASPSSLDLNARSKIGKYINSTIGLQGCPSLLVFALDASVFSI
jgi:hypothetical protein